MAGPRGLRSEAQGSFGARAAAVCPGLGLCNISVHRWDDGAECARSSLQMPTRRMDVAAVPAQRYPHTLESWAGKHLVRLN